MKIPLSITEDYCPDWKAWHGVREIMQNAVDADDDGYQMSVQHKGATLTVKNERVVLDTRVLLLGGTMGKSSNARGKHREGLKIGLLALRRAGCEVAIFSGDEVWRPEIEPSEQFSGQRVLVINTRKLRTPREDFTVEIVGISKEVWDALSKRFLFVRKPSPNEVVETDQGLLLLSDEYRGAIFSRGIYVCDVPDLACGYDLRYLDLDRDRQVVSSWDLRYKLATLWEANVERDPVRHVPTIYRMAKAGAEEIQALRHYGSAKLAKALRAELEKEHGGGGVVPVSTIGDAQAVEELGAKAVIVEPAFRELLEKDGNTLQAVKEARKRGVKARFKLSDLSSGEIMALDNTVRRVAKPEEIVVVEYNDPTMKGQYDAENKLFQFSRPALALPERDLLRMAVAQAAIHQGKSTDDVYLDLLCPTVTAVVEQDLAQGAAPALATNQTVRELTAAEAPDPFEGVPI